MQTLPTQLAIPGEYTSLNRNIVAPSLRKQLHAYNKILHTHKNILSTTAFRDNEFTSKAGGLPSWLPPSPPESSTRAPQNNQSKAPKFTQQIPSCLGCKTQMFLITQIFSPIDFIMDLPQYDPGTPILSCYTGSVIKKAASAVNLNSTAPDTIINVSRHARTLYVFACCQGTCAYNPGAWKTVSLTQSAPKNIMFSPTGLVVFKKAQSQGKSSAQTADDDNFDVEFDNLDDIDDDEDDEDYEADYPEDETETKIDEALPSDISPVITKCQPIAPTSAPVPSLKASILTSKTKGEDTFSMGGWSDSEDEQEANTTTTSTTPSLTQLQELVAETQAIQLKVSGKSEKQIKIDLEKAKLSKKRKAKGIKTHVPIIVEPKIEILTVISAGTGTVNGVSYRNQDGEEDVVAKASPDDIVFFRPFYLWWQGEDASTAKKTDHSREEQLLKEYYAQDGQDDEEEGDTSGPVDNEDEDDVELDPYDVYQDAVNQQPEQVIRYFNSNLSLHPQPSRDQIDKFQKSSKAHPMHKFSHQSGVWLLHDVPKCKGCGEQLVLECQILPTLLTEMRPDDFELVYHRSRYEPSSGTGGNSDGDKGDEDEGRKKKKKEAQRALESKFDLDWGLVNIYSCLNLCSPDEYIPGFCLVQPGI